MNSKKEKFARFGIASKGFVYVLIGVLTGFAAFSMGGRKTGSKGALTYLAEKPYGQFLLVIIAAGLIGYVFWRLYECVFDSNKQGKDIQGVLNRIGYFFGALFYGYLAYFALQLAFGMNTKQDQNWIISLLNSENGKLYSIIFGLILIGKAIFEFYIAYSNMYKKNVHASSLDSNIKSFLLKSGRFGYTSRGIVFLIMSFLTFRAVVESQGPHVNTKIDAFRYLQNEFGEIVLAVVALGLISYGFFMFVKAKYLTLNLS